MIIDHFSAAAGCAARTASKEDANYPLGTARKPVPATPAAGRAVAATDADRARLQDSYLIAPHLVDREDLALLGILTQSISNKDKRKLLTDNRESCRELLKAMEDIAKSVSPLEVARARQKLDRHVADGCAEVTEAAFDEWKTTFTDLMDVLPEPLALAAQTEAFFRACMRFPESLRDFISTAVHAAGCLEKPDEYALIISQKLRDRDTYASFEAQATEALTAQKALAALKVETASLRQRLKATDPNRNKPNAGGGAPGGGKGGKPYVPPTVWKEGMRPCKLCQGNHLDKECPTLTAAPTLITDRTLSDSATAWADEHRRHADALMLAAMGGGAAIDDMALQALALDKAAPVLCATGDVTYTE
ncbi:MAG: hypothetical protein VXZ39_11575, partial [Planctomycetota bacterium]|nr:hypothetical protein [Planctomycetota bacterium]